jgi:hypothetical protein
MTSLRSDCQLPKVWSNDELCALVRKLRTHEQGVVDVRQRKSEVVVDFPLRRQI